MKKANVLKALVAVATIFIGLTFTQCSSVDSQLKEVAKEMNDMCPMEMGGGVRLDKVTAESGKKLAMSMAVSTIAANSSEAQMFTNMVKPMMVQSVKANNSPDYKKIKDMGVIFIFNFYDGEGVAICDVELGPNDYI